MGVRKQTVVVNINPNNTLIANIITLMFFFISTFGKNRNGRQKIALACIPTANAKNTDEKIYFLFSKK